MENREAGDRTGRGATQRRTAAQRTSRRKCSRRWSLRALAGRAPREAQRGMTLIEIIVVVAIMGLIAAAVVVAVLPRFRKGQEETAKILVRKVQAAAVEYYIQNGQCPGDVSELKDYGITRESEKDSWGTELEIRCDTANDVVEVRSAGRDKSMGNDDDVFYPPPEGE